MNSHRITHDTDHIHELHTEKRVHANRFIVPILNALPVWSRPLIRRTHRAADVFVKQAMRYDALEVAYTGGAQYPSRNALERFFHWVWFETSNVIAVRNRLRLVKRELKKALRARLKHEPSVRLLSIAAGSARAVLEAVHEEGLAHNRNITLVFLDKDPSALAYSKTLAKDLAVTCPIEWVEATAGTYLRSSKGKNYFDIVEMVGLLDYFPDDRAVPLFDEIYDVLTTGGTYITGNVIAHDEKPLLSRFAGWHVIYREPEELLALLVRSKFTLHNIEVYVEPHRIHSVSVAIKGNA